MDNTLGIDFLLDADGDLVISPAGDYQLTSGVQNVEQRLGLRFLTPVGDYPFDNTYGSLVSILSQIDLSPNNQAQIISAVRGAAAADPGILTVDNVTLIPGDQVIVNIETTTITGDQVTGQVVIA